jgi:hypothetical protein
VESISNAMQKLWKDETLRQTLIEKGFSREKDFSWDRTADSFWNSIERV